MWIALFKNVREVMRADTLCRGQGIRVAVMPVPESVSSECGMCLRIASEEREALAELCRMNNIEVTYGEF